MNKQNDKNSNQLIEQLYAENELKTKWLSLVSHDFKGMFHNVLLLLEAIESKTISQEMFLNMLPELKEDARKNLKTLESMFAWVHTQTDVFNPQIEEIVIHQLFLHLVDEFSVKITQKNINLKFIGDENLSVNTDKYLLTFMLKQTIDNAIKYSYKNAEVIVEVNKQADTIIIEIRDNGIGMNNEVFTNLFTLNGPNFKGTMDEKGAGLSLIIVKDISDKLNIKMDVTSSINEMTSVKFLFYN